MSAWPSVRPFGAVATKSRRVGIFPRAKVHSLSRRTPGQSRRPPRRRLLLAPRRSPRGQATFSGSRCPPGGGLGAPREACRSWCRPSFSGGGLAPKVKREEYLPAAAGRAAARHRGSGWAARRRCRARCPPLLARGVRVAFHLFFNLILSKRAGPFILGLFVLGLVCQLILWFVKIWEAGQRINYYNIVDSVIF